MTKRMEDTRVESKKKTQRNDRMSGRTREIERVGKNHQRIKWDEASERSAAGKFECIVEQHENKQLKVMSSCSTAHMIHALAVSCSVIR